MKTVKDYILEMIDEKNTENEPIDDYEILEQEIDKYIKDRSIEENLSRFKDNEKFYTKLALLKVKHFQTYSYSMLLFYFMNYSIITELLMIKGDICYRLNHNISISKEEALDLYHRSISLAGECRRLEYSDKTIEVHLKDIKNLLKITE